MTAGPPATSARSGAQSLERAFGLLSAFTPERPDWALGELSQFAGLAPSTTRRLLRAFVAAGLLEQNERTRHYSLGLRLAQLGAIALGATDLVHVAQPVMRELVAKVREAAYLGRLTQSGVVIVAVAQPSRAVRLSGQVGDVFAAHATSTGKVLLAGLDDALLEQWLARPLPQFSPLTHTDAKLLRRELLDVRERGYAVALQEFGDEWASVAAPVFDHLGATVGALAVGGSAHRIGRSDLDFLSVELTKASQAISARLGAPVTTAK